MLSVNFCQMASPSRMRQRKEWSSEDGIAYLFIRDGQGGAHAVWGGRVWEGEGGGGRGWGGRERVSGSGEAGVGLYINYLAAAPANMLPFDFSIQQQCMADCYNDLGFSDAACPEAYPVAAYSTYWLPDCPPAPFPYPYLYYLPSPEKDDPKPCSPTTDTLNNQGPQEPPELQEEVLEVEPEEEEVSGSKSDQRFGRNIVSNIFQTIIKKCTTEPAFAAQLEAITRHSRMTTTAAQFQERLREKTGRLRGYISMKSMKGMLMKKRIGATRADQEFSKVLRIVSRIYIHRYHIPHLYHSSKIKKKSRDLHLKRMRQLLRQLS